MNELQAVSAASATRHVQFEMLACFAALFALFGLGLEAAFERMGLAPPR